MPRKFPCLVAFECPGCLVKGKGQTVNGRDFHWNAYRPHNAETSVILVGLQRFSATQVSSRSKAPVVQPFECPVPGLTAGFDKVAGVEQRCKGLGEEGKNNVQCPPDRMQSSFVVRAGRTSNTELPTGKSRKPNSKLGVGRSELGISFYPITAISNVERRIMNVKVLVQ